MVWTTGATGNVSVNGVSVSTESGGYTGGGSSNTPFSSGGGSSVTQSSVTNDIADFYAGSSSKSAFDILDDIKAGYASGALSASIGAIETQKITSMISAEEAYKKGIITTDDFLRSEGGSPTLVKEAREQAALSTSYLDSKGHETYTIEFKSLFRINQLSNSIWKSKLDDKLRSKGWNLYSFQNTGSNSGVIVINKAGSVTLAVIIAIIIAIISVVAGFISYNIRETKTAGVTARNDITTALREGSITSDEANQLLDIITAQDAQIQDFKLQEQAIASDSPSLFEKVINPSQLGMILAAALAIMILPKVIK